MLLALLGLCLLWFVGVNEFRQVDGFLLPFGQKFEVSPMVFLLFGFLALALSGKAVIERAEASRVLANYSDTPVLSGDLENLKANLKGHPAAQALVKETVERSASDVLTYGELLEIEGDLLALIERDEEDAERQRARVFVAELGAGGAAGEQRG